MNRNPRFQGQSLRSAPGASYINGVSGSNGGYTSSPQNARGGPVSNGYGKENMNGYEQGDMRSNSNSTRTRSSSLLDVNDEIQVHLLVETALGDSKEYEVLSPEEVDGLKRNVQSLTSTIDQTRQNLAIQRKYRDAAINMSRLYANSNRSSTDSDGRKRRSLLGHNRTPSNEVKDVEQERQLSERKCEELAVELERLEKKLAVAQDRLLKHTAGVLQMTHKGALAQRAKKDLLPNGIPGSPESMYSYHISRNSLDLISEADVFDERSLYKNADAWNDGPAEAASKQPKEVIEVNKGPSQVQMQMITATEAKLENLNTQLRDLLVKANPQRELPLPPQKSRGDADPLEALQDHLEYLERNISTFERDHDDLVRERSQSVGLKNNTDQTETVMMGLWDIIQSGEEAARARKRDRRQTRTMQNLPPEDDDSEDEEVIDEKFSPQAFSSKVQWLYSQATKLKDQKKVLARQIKQQRELNSKSDATKDAELAQKAEELERTTALLTRTEIDADSVREQLSMVMEKLDEARQQEQLRDQAKSTNESAAIKQIQDELNQRIQRTARLEEELQDLKDDHSIEQAEARAKLEEAESKASKLTQEIAIAVAAKNAFDTTTSEKDTQIRSAQSTIQELQNSISQRDGDFTSITQELQQKEQDIASHLQSLQRLESLVAQKDKEIASHSEEVQASSSKHRDLQSSVAKRDAEFATISGTLQQKEKELVKISQTLQAKEQDFLLNTQAIESWERDFREASEKLKKAESQIESSNVEIARLTTEVTFARADLDSAYGSRAERAAEKAIDPATQKQIDELQQQLEQLQLKNFELTTEVAELRERRPASSGSGNEAQIKILKQELSETIEEFEAMTKASIEWEKDREALEVQVDKLRDEREAIENQLSDEKVRWLGMKSPGLEGGSAGPVGGSTSTTVLRTEFRKMMRDTRDANTKLLRAEQEARKKAEDELRAIKKQYGPLKIGLTPTYGMS